MVGGRRLDAVLLIDYPERFQQLVEIDETVLVEVDALGDLRDVLRRHRSLRILSKHLKLRSYWEWNCSIKSIF